MQDCAADPEWNKQIQSSMTNLRRTPVLRACRWSNAIFEPRELLSGHALVFDHPNLEA